MSDASAPHPLLRPRDGHHARVTYEELFFDLVYVFAVTQLSHALQHHLGAVGFAETLILWFAVWLGWQYSCWVTNWFNPEAPALRALLFATMLLALLMAASLPEAFGDRGLWFALAYVAMQVGRTAFIVLRLPAAHPLAPNYRRMLGWLLISAVFWIAGACVDHGARMALWLLAVACEYVSPMFGFALPGLGRSRTRDWTIEGGHLAERCQLFVIVALGETLLANGPVLGGLEHWDAGVLLAVLVIFAGTVAMWWLYFGTSSRDATAAITAADDPGRIGALFHYLHAILVAGIIVAAVGSSFVLAAPRATATLAQLAALGGGPALYLLGGALYKRVVYGVLPLSHVVGAVGLLAALALLRAGPLLLLGAVSAVVMFGVAGWEAYACRTRAAVPAVRHGV
ncbi:low temperature requirement protein A [Solimonas flava]|uniref:low temperature requirement protein A n=1 Tax=Solimonas flava TaxID=415849 RepID=UPI000410F286|nr:low temperature requirement protein A [Solimonas flava]